MRFGVLRVIGQEAGTPLSGPMTGFAQDRTPPCRRQKKKGCLTPAGRSECLQIDNAIQLYAREGFALFKDPSVLTQKKTDGGVDSRNDLVLYWLRFGFGGGPTPSRQSYPWLKGLHENKLTRS